MAKPIADGMPQFVKSLKQLIQNALRFPVVNAACPVLPGSGINADQ